MTKTNNTDIANQPHVVCFVANDGRLTPCLDGDNVPGSLSTRWAIYVDRDTAEANVDRWSDGQGVVKYFTAPADTMFAVEEVVTKRFVRLSS
jgi:hypothetical protein